MMTTNINLKEVEAIANKFENDLYLVKKEIKRVQSVKCRLAKQKGKSTYEDEMNEVIKYIQVLSEARNLLDPKIKPVHEFNEDDIKVLTYDQVVKAIRTIQSKKTNTKWLTNVPCDNDEYRQAEKVEQMLIKRRKELKPVDDNCVKKTDIKAVIETIESSGNLSQETILDMLRNLL